MMQALARRALKTKGFHWLRGMAEDEPGLPNLEDAATLGCLFQLVLEAWEEPEFFVIESEYMMQEKRTEWRVNINNIIGIFDTYAEALVAALEAADNKELLTPWENEQ